MGWSIGKRDPLRGRKMMRREMACFDVKVLESRGPISGATTLLNSAAFRMPLDLAKQGRHWSGMR